jgi:hypothetical protein
LVPPAEGEEAIETPSFFLSSDDYFDCEFDSDCTDKYTTSSPKYLLSEDTCTLATSANGGASCIVTEVVTLVPDDVLLCAAVSGEGEAF